ncbi:MAG TPA: calcium/sodium antiporter, partial [Pseudomonadaceae bacterium]|nr:calcium/sodium antiporter [Pseudomonadaceae bacterium]
MLIPLFAVVAGLLLLIWSADRFIDGAAATATHVGMPPLLIGMVIVGFGTSAPELVVSLFAAIQGNPGIALGNAFGSNIANIGLILGITALISPIAVHSQVVRKEMPILIALCALVAWQLFDGYLSRTDALLLLLVFGLIMGFTIRQGIREDSAGTAVLPEVNNDLLPLRNAIIWLVVGLILLIIASRVLVWGAVSIAVQLGVSDLIIGLTIVAIGTSLPELASSLAAIRKNEHDLALGNIVGSNLFNTLAVVGIAGSIHPLAVERELLVRDVGMMTLMTVLLFVFAFGIRKPAQLSRVKGA